MAEAEDPDLLEPKTDAERDLVRQLKEGRLKRQQQQQQQQQQGQSTPSGMEDDSAVAMSVDGQPGLDPSTSGVMGGHEGTRVGRKMLGGRCFYTRLPTRLVKQQGLTAAELTARNLDKSPVLLQAAMSRYGKRLTSSADGMGALAGLLGELQFSFVAFIYGQSLDGFSQVSGVRCRTGESA